MSSKKRKSTNLDDNVLLRSQITSSAFHVAMKFPLQLAQCFGFFPMYVGGSTIESLKIKWFHWRMAYCLLTFVLAILYTLAEVLMWLQNTKKSAGLIFCIDCLTKYVICFKLTLDWPNFVKAWHDVEDKLKKYELCSQLQNYLNKITLTMMSIAVVEHILIDAFLLKMCLQEEPSFLEAMKKYAVKRNYKAIFRLLDYSLTTGILFELTNLQLTFMWNYGDVFIMLIGTALKCKLEQITKRIKKLCKLHVQDVKVWSTIRNDYVQLSKLCCITNKQISLLIIVSFSSNLYFIIKQLFSSLRPMESTLEKLYFYVSFGLLVARLISVCIFGSSLHVEWENTLVALQSVKSAAYNIEVVRLIETVSISKLVLSGNNFFGITRGLILKIAGVIVTYELVAIQFNMDTLNSDIN